MHILFGLLAFFLGAFGRRIAGGALPELTPWNAGDQVVRLFFGLTVALAALMGGVSWLLCLAMIPATWVGTTTSNFDSMAMGRGGHNSFARDFAGMTLHGVLSAALPALGAWYMGFAWWPIALSGFLIAPLYDLGWRISPNGGTGITWMPLFLRVGTAFGEFFWGGAVALLTYFAATIS